MTRAEAERLFTELKFASDVRRPPDDSRRRQFQTGWNDASERRADYSEATLSRLTWRNLGYRFGQHGGPQHAEAIDAVYRILAQSFIQLWVPRSYEDRLLQAYWHRVGGRLYVEVPIGMAGGPGDWPTGSTRRRLDGVRFLDVDDRAIVRFTSTEFRDRVAASEVELIEAKPALNRTAIGQVIAGREMFRREYGIDAQHSVVVCGASDGALAWVCGTHDIRVEILGPGP